MSITIRVFFESILQVGVRRYRIFCVVPVSRGHGDRYTYLKSSRKEPTKGKTARFVLLVYFALLPCGTCC